jgi:meso-butanediol dehydrogenase / (S,S)-butanediol dehydrogenase / diacetyl reductase
MNTVSGRLQDRVAIVTGTARGIGEAIARQFAIEGAIVVGVDIMDERGEAGARKVVDAGGRMEYRHCDVTKEDEIRALVRGVEAGHGRIDILVNNAVAQREAPITEFTVEDFYLIINSCLFATAVLCREVIPGMKARKSGAIVNMSSVLGWVADPILPIYGAAKAGILGMTRSIAIAHGEDNIRCNAICPGDVDTELNQVYFAAHPDPVAFRARVEHEYPMRRIASTDEIARVAVFLASDDASFITGQDIIADGGILARIYEL